MRPIPGTPTSWSFTNQSAPSGPTVMSSGQYRPHCTSAVSGSANSLIWPVVVIRPTLLALRSVNQSAPSGPATIPVGSLCAVSAYSVYCPLVLIRPMWAPFRRVNHRAPSGPAATKAGGSDALPCSGNACVVPLGEILTRLSGLLSSMYQTAPSGPAVAWAGIGLAPGSWNVVNLGDEAVGAGVGVGDGEADGSAVGVAVGVATGVLEGVAAGVVGRCPAFSS